MVMHYVSRCATNWPSNTTLAIVHPIAMKKLRSLSRSSFMLLLYRITVFLVAIVFFITCPPRTLLVMHYYITYSLLPCMSVIFLTMDRLLRSGVVDPVINNRLGHGPVRGDLLIGEIGEEVVSNIHHIC